jgi:uncharacterized protein (TIGR00255 family)
MTGYGRGQQGNNELIVTVEMKSVNHRFCDVFVRMPKQMLMYEDRIKKAVQKTVKRGKVDVYVSVEGTGIISRQLHVDWELVGQYYEAFEKLKSNFSSTDKFSLNQFIQNPEIFQVTEKEGDIKELEQLLMKATETATEELCAMRQKEGFALVSDFTKRLTRMKEITNKVKEQSELVVQAYREKLHTKMSEVLAGSLDVDEARLLTEVAVYVDKSDINEELQRLDSHIIQFENGLTLEGPIGRKLDFLTQEMNREINTIGAKSNAIQISKAVVELKTELEKLKEQVQNIE